MAMSSFESSDNLNCSDSVKKIYDLLSNGKIDEAYELHLEISKKVEENIPDQVLREITNLNGYFMKYLETTKENFPLIVSKIDSLMSDAKKDLGEQNTSSAKKYFYDIKAYYDKIPSLMYDEKYILYERLSLLRKTIISKERDLFNKSLTRKESEVTNLKYDIFQALENGNILQAEGIFKSILEIYLSIPSNAGVLRMKIYNEILLLRHEINVIKDVEAESRNVGDDSNLTFKKPSKPSIETPINVEPPKQETTGKITKNKFFLSIPKVKNPSYSYEPLNPETIFNDADEGSIDEIPRIAADYETQLENLTTEELNKMENAGIVIETDEEDVEDSKDVYTELLEDDPNNPLLNYVVPILSNTFLEKKFDYDERLIEAMQAYNGKDYNRAKELFDSVLKEAPDNTKAQQMLMILNALVSDDIGTA